LAGAKRDDTYDVPQSSSTKKKEKKQSSSTKKKEKKQSSSTKKKEEQAKHRRVRTTPLMSDARPMLFSISSPLPLPNDDHGLLPSRCAPDFSEE
jgi:hypothetical protein